MNKNDQKKMKKIEREFLEAEESIKKMGIDEDAGTDIIELAPEAYEIDEVGPVEDGNVFDLMELKKDFILVKRNLHKMIRRGQNMMDTLNNIDLEEMGAQKLIGIGTLSNSVAMQLKMLVEIYKDIAEIEKTRRPEVPGVIQGAVQGDVNQNIIFAGDTSELLRHINKNK